jgi:trk system potassium uptake protein
MPSLSRRSVQEPSGKEFAIIGLGTFGSSLARRLESLGHVVLAVDGEMERVQAISADVTSAVALDATNENALVEVDITSFPTVIVAIDDNFEDCVLVTEYLKRVGVARVICTAEHRRHRDILLRIGADQVILSDEDSGVRLAETLASPSMVERVLLDDAHSLAEMKAPRSLVGHALASLAQYETTVLLIQRQGTLIPCPPVQTAMEAGDTLFVVGKREKLLMVAALP